MADTKRTATDLLTNLFQDGQSAGISAQDLRDFVSSCRPPFGGASVTGNASATTITVQSTYYPINATFIAGSLVEVGITASGGKMTYTGTPARHFHVVSNLDAFAATNNQILSFQWFKNGVAIAPPIKCKITSGGDIATMSIHTDVMLSTNDYLELKVTNTSSTATVTIENCYLFMHGMIM